MLKVETLLSKKVKNTGKLKSQTVTEFLKKVKEIEEEPLSVICIAVYDDNAIIDKHSSVSLDTATRELTVFKALSKEIVDAVVANLEGPKQ
jgi:hypothetical protein